MLNIINYRIVIMVIELIDDTTDKIFWCFVVLDAGIAIVTRPDSMPNVIYLYKR